MKIYVSRVTSGTNSLEPRANKFWLVPPDFTAPITGGVGATQLCFMRGGSVPSFNPLAFDRPFLDRKGTPSVYFLLTNGAPFHIPSLEHGIPFNCYECTVRLLTHSVTHLLMPMNAVRHVGQQQRMDTPVCSGPASERFPRFAVGS